MKQVVVNTLEHVSTKDKPHAYKEDRTSAKIYELTARDPKNSYINVDEPAIVVMSGQNYSEWDQLTMALNIAKTTKRRVIYVSNFTEGARDFIVSAKSKLGTINAPILALMKIFAGKWGAVDSAMGHSQGGIYLSEALRRLSPETRKGLNVMTFGGAAWTYASGVKAQHFVDPKDPTPVFLGRRYGKDLQEYSESQRTNGELFEEGFFGVLSAAHSAHSYFGYDRDKWNYNPRDLQIIGFRPIEAKPQK